jgi:hypothetical protein
MAEFSQLQYSVVPPLAVARPSQGVGDTPEARPSQGEGDTREAPSKRQLPAHYCAAYAS